MNKLISGENIYKLYDRTKKYIPIFLITMFFAVFFLYLLIMNNESVNHYDALWWYTYRMAGEWEVSIGRWFLPFLDSLHLGTSIEPMTSIVSLVLLTTGMILILSIFKIRKKYISVFINMLFLSNVVVGAFLSYKYEAITFCLSFFLSILAAFCIIRIQNKYIAILLSGEIIAIMMGCYQSNFGCTCLVLLLYLIYMLNNLKSKNEIKEYLIKSAAAIIFGGILYIILVNIHLKIYNVSLSSYLGANTYSIMNSIVKLPNSIVQCYKLFISYFMGEIINLNVFQFLYKNMYFLTFLSLFILLLYGCIKIWKQSKIRVLFYMIQYQLLVMLPC